MSAYARSFDHPEYLHDLGLSTSRQASIYFTAIGVLIIAFLRLFLELYQLVTQHWRYVLDWINWLEWCLFICSIIFVWVFSSDCLCVSDRRWQVGVVAIFLGWIGLINFISKLPYIGIYVLMFFEILKTVLKLIAFAFLLVLGFGLVFYMTFFEPGITVCQYCQVTSIIGLNLINFLITALSILHRTSFLS